MTQELPEPVRFIRRPWRRNRVWSGLSRSTAALTAFALLLSQLVIPVAAAEQNELPRWLTEEEGGWVSPEQAGRMQRADQDLLAHLSALEGAQQRFVLSHPSGLQTQYAGGELVVARDAQGNLLWSPTLDDYQKLQNGTLLLADGTLQVVRDGRLTRQVDPFGNETFFGADGQAEYEIAVDGTRTTYQRTVTPLGTQVARTTGGITDRFSFDPQGRLYAAASDHAVSSADPFSITFQSFTPGSGIATGVVATDGTYLYVKPAGGTGKVFRKIGTGFNGTVAGRKYGTLTGAVKGSISAAVAGDGLLYQPDPTNLNRVERINPATGQKSFVSLATPFLPSQSSPAGRWTVLITSDGRYVYNLSSHQSRSSTIYNGWTIRVYDPQNGWAMVREFTAGTTSFAPAGGWSDGVFLYLLEKKTGGSAKVVTVRIADAAVVRSSSTPAGRKLLTGQYDGRNQRLWVGTSTGGKIYAQDNPNDLPRANWEEPADPRSPGIWNETRWPIPSNPPQSSTPRTAPALAANEAPIGYLDSADPYLLSGWAVDPNDPAGPQKVRVLLNGQVWGEPILADLPRPDLVAAGIAPNAEHGYHIATTTLNLAPGTYTVSIEAQDSQTQQWTPLTYTKTLVIAPAQPPIGYLDSADETTLSGWAVDPDNASASARVQVVVDGNVRGEPVSANQPRGDLVAAGIAPNPEHGYRIDTARLGLTPGTHTLSVQAQDSQTGQWFLLTHSKTVVIPGNRSPIGYLDFAGLDRISGWSVDPDDRAAAQQVEILVDGAVKATVTANQSRGDLVAAGIAPNPEHGYSIAPADLGLAPGAHTVTARSIDTQTGQRKDLAGTHTLVIPANQPPIGYLDFADLDRISGWSVDPDSRSGAQQIEILVDGVVKTTVTANQPRSDLVAAGIAPNAEHGYSLSTADLNLSIGSHTITTQSIDAQTGQRTVLTGSKTLVIIDRAPPLATLESLLLVNQRTYTLTYRVTDNIDPARVVTENVILTEGENRLTRIVGDAAGNTTTVAWTVTLDTIPPALVLTSATLTKQPAYMLTYTVDGAARNESVTLQEGSNSISRTTTDAAGNQTVSNWTVTLDTIAPAVVLTSVTLTNKPAYMLTYTVDGAARNESVTLQEGSNSISRTTTDAAGNQTVSNWTVTLDTIPPALVLTSATLTKQPAYTLIYTVDGAARSEARTLQEGDNSITFPVTDAAGNQTVSNWTVTLDTIAPAVVLTSVTLTNKPAYMLTYTVDGAARNESVTLQEGSNSISRTASDAAGNQTVSNWTVTLDTIPPALVLTSATLTKQPAYMLTYTVDGAAQSETRTLAEGPNPVNKMIFDTAGNSTVVSWIITLETPLTLPTLGSPAQTDAEQYQAVITAGGQPLSTETWRLGRGTHQLLASASNSAGKTARARLAVTRTGSLPEPPNPPEEPQGNRLTQTLADGSVAAYVEGQLVLVTTTDGTQLKGPMLDTEGKITGGWIVTPDGTTTYLENGTAVWSKEAGGSVTWYFSDGRVEAVRNADGSLTSYGYRLNAAGQIDAILVTAGDLSTLLDPDGKLTQQLRQDGRWLSYQNGRLARIESPGQTPIAYTETVQPDGTILIVRPEPVEGQSTDLPRRFLYAADSSLQEVTQADGTVILFNNGIPTGILQPDGTTTSISIQESGGILSGLTVIRSGITRAYDAQGQMASLRLADGSNLTIDSDQLKGVGLPDGAQVIDGVYDADNRLVSGRVLLPDGRTVTYAAGQPTEAKLPDGTKITYDSNGTPTRLQLSTDLAYTVSRYTVTPLPIIVEEPPADDPQPYWVATLVNPDDSPFVLSSSKDERLTQILYSANWILQEATRADGAHLTYTVIASPEGAKQSRLSTLTQANGLVISYAYDSASRLASTVAVSPDPAEPALRTEYAYDKIRRVLKGTVPEGGLSPDWDLVYDYSYEFETDGMEITVIREPAAGLTKRYRAGLLISQTDPDGAVTAYEYTADPAGYSDPMETAVGAVRSLSDGTIAHYTRSPAGAWTLSKLTLADGTELLPEELNPPNLLGNFASLEEWSNHSPFDGPDGWRLSFDTGAAIAQETSPENIHSGVSSVRLTTGPGGGDSAIYRDIVPMYSPELADYEGKTVTLGAWVKTSDPAVYLALLDDVASSTRSSDHPGDGQWHFLTVTHTVGRGGIAKLVAFLLTHGPNTTAYFDDAVFVVGPAILAQDFSSLIEEAALPTGRTALRRMVEQGTLTLIQPDALDQQLQTAVGAVQTLSDGIRAHYDRTADLTQPWNLVQFTRPDGSELSGWGRQDDSLTDHNGVGSVSGKIGNAASFTPAAWDNRTHLDAPAGPDLNMANTDFTFSLWVYLEDKSTNMVILGKGLPTSEGHEYILLYDAPSTDRFRLVVTDGGADSRVYAHALGSPSVNTWYFITGGYDSSSGSFFLQVNDGEVDRSYPPPGVIRDTSVGLRLGEWNDYSTVTDALNGRIDEVGIWKKALTDRERADLYNAGAGNTFRQDRYAFDVDSGHSLADGLVSYYNLDESSGTRADSANLSSLTAQAALPIGRTALRRMVETGVLSLRGSEATEAISETASEGTVPAQGLSPAQPASVLTRATVSYQGKERETFTYRYEYAPGTVPEGGLSPVLTYVTDAAGVTRGYDGTQRLVSIEQPDGTEYAVTYGRDLSDEQRQALESTRLRTFQYTELDGSVKTIEIADPDVQPFGEQKGEEITLQHLTRRRLKDGTELKYAFGQVQEIRLPDGRILTDFTVDRNGIPLRATLKLPDGTQRAIQNGSLVELTREDGVQLRYRDDALVEVGVPVNAVDKVTVSAVGVDAEGHLKSGEILLPSGDRLFLQGGRFTSARLSDGTEVRSVTVEQDMLTGAVLSVNGSNALLSDTRNVEVTLPSGQKYLYRYKLGADGQPTDELETMTFRDDFEDGNSLGWVVQTGSDWTVTGGDLRGRDTEYAYSITTTGLNWADYTVTTRFTYEQLGRWKDTSIFFRWQGPSNYYQLRLLDRSSQPDRGVGWLLEFSGVVGGGWIGENIVTGLGSFNPNSMHTLTVAVQGSTFHFYLDGQHVGSKNHGGISRGTIGVGVNDATTRFHDIEVTFPGEDLRDDATYQVDSRLRDLRQVVSEAVGPLSSLGFLPPKFDPELANSIQMEVLEESNDPDVKAVVAAVRQATSDPTLPVVTEMDTQGRLISAQRIDGSVVTYNAFQKPVAQYDIDGRLQTEYRYDADGRLIQLSMRAAREGFNERQEVLEREVVRRKAEALQELARQKNRLDLEMEANITVARESLANIATTIQEQLRTFQTMDAKGKEAKKQKSQAVGQIQQGLKEVLDKQKEVEEQYAQALGQLHGEVETQRNQIDTETNKAFAELNTQKENFFKEILRQEIRPVVDWVYRDVLGRDPSLETELKPLVEQAYEQQKDLPSNQAPPPIDVETLAQTLRSLPEHADRTTEVQAIKQQVGQQLNDYIRAPPQERQALLDSLGLTTSEVVDLTQQDADQVLQWLLSQGNHFGHSAFLALKEYLAGQGIQAGTVELAAQTILIDILVGVLNPKTAGDLELSLFSLQRVAKLHLPADGSVAGGGAFSAQVDFADLKSLLSAGPVIAHVNGNHYMVILSIAADGTVTYREPNQGPAGETFTMTEAELGRIWKGAILTPRAPPHAYQILTDHEAQQIRGSFFLAAIIFLIIKFREQIAEFLQSVAVWINDYLPTFISPIKSVLSSYFAGWANILQGNFKEGLIQLGTVALTVAMAIINPVAFAIAITVSTALNALGVNPTISGLVSAFISGGVTGGLAAASSLAANAAFTFGAAVGEGIVSGLISAASNGAQLGLVHLGVDPALASLAGIGVHTLTSSFTQGIDIQGTTSTGAPFTWHATGFEALSHVFSTQLVPTLAGELGIYGITKLGESIGLDPRISQLAGMTIGNGFRAIATPANSAKTTMDSMWEGLKKGALQVGLQFATPGLDPLLGGMASSIITGAIDGLISPQDPNKPLGQRKGIFTGIADTFHEAIKGFEDIGVIKTNDPVGNAQRLAQLTDFTQIVQGPGGLAAAIETYGTGFLYRSSVESLISAGTALDKDHAIQAAINAQLQDPNTPLVELEGRPALQINLGGGNHLWVDPNSHALLATLQGQDYIRYVAPPKVDTATHTAAATNAEITRTLEDGSKLILEVRDGLVTKARLTRGDQSWLFTGNEVGDLQLSSDGTIFTGQLVDEPTGLSFVFDRGSLTKTVLLPTITSALSVGQLAAVADILESSSPILFEPTPEMTQQHLQDFNLEVGNLQNLLAAKFGTNKAQALVAEFKQSGQTVIQTPETQANERQRLAEQTSSVELSDSERRTMGEIVTDWANGLRTKGIQMGANAEEGGLAYWAGFGVYFLGDLTDIGADPLRIGEGFGKAFAEDLPNKHYGAALWHITEDVFRGIQFIPGIALASKSVSGAIKTVQTSGKVAEATGALNRVKSGVMNFVSTWSKRFGIGDDVLGVASDAKGSLKYEYAFNESQFKGLTHAASTEKLKSLASGINPQLLSKENRFGKAFYLSEDSGTAIAEVKYKVKVSGGTGPDVVIQYNLDAPKSKILDLTDPTMRTRYGYIPDPKDYSTGKRAAELAKQDGYNVIKYESIRNPGHNNYAVLDNADFDELLRARLPLQ